MTGGLVPYGSRESDEGEVQRAQAEGGKIGHTMDTAQPGEVVRVVLGRDIGQNRAFGQIVVIDNDVAGGLAADCMRGASQAAPLWKVSTG